ncbi:hypothetical protein ACQ4PT_015139 [Festuca glaucescens]
MGARARPRRLVIVNALAWHPVQRIRVLDVLVLSACTVEDQEEGCEGGAATRRQLVGNSYIGYDALRRNAVLCSYRGTSCCGRKTWQRHGTLRRRSKQTWKDGLVEFRSARQG